MTATDATAAETVVVSDEMIERIRAGELVVIDPTDTPEPPPTVEPTKRSLLPNKLTIDELLERRQLLIDAKERAMEAGVHYGQIAGIKKPALLKPGAEILCALFKLGPFFPDERQRDLTDEMSNHRDCRSLCVLRHIESGLEVGEAHGACSTRESKYAYRSGALICPECGEGSVKKGKTRDKSADQFYCHRRVGGCGATWDVGDPVFDELEATRKEGLARIPNRDLADSWNTVLKMSEKRAFIAVTLMATGASEFFTQDVEDQPGPAGSAESSTREPVRQNPPDHPPIPQTVDGLQVALEELGIDKVWLAQMLQHLFGQGLRWKDLDRDQRNLFGQRGQTVFTRVYTFAKEGRINIEAVPGPKRSEIQAVFASVLDGVELEGPPWRVQPVTYDPSEEPFPSREEYEAEQAELEESESAEDADAADGLLPAGALEPQDGDDDIPFGPADAPADATD